MSRHQILVPSVVQATLNNKHKWKCTRSTREKVLNFNEIWWKAADFQPN